MTAAPEKPNLEVVDLGRCAYLPALGLQKRLVSELTDEPARAVLLTLEHDPPVVTLGRRAEPGDVVASAAQLAAAGIEVRRSRRGGRATWHGPGQLVGYLICRLDRRRLTLRGFVDRLEQAVIDTLGRFGLAAERREGLHGVWVGGRKVAAVGVAVERWVTYHGLALNVRPDLSGFETIAPCGLTAAEVTSMERLGSSASIEDVKGVLTQAVREAFDFGPARAAPHQSETQATVNQL